MHAAEEITNWGRASPPPPLRIGERPKKKRDGASVVVDEAAFVRPSGSDHSSLSPGAPSPGLVDPHFLTPCEFVCGGHFVGSIGGDSVGQSFASMPRSPATLAAYALQAYASEVHRRSASTLEHTEPVTDAVPPSGLLLTSSRAPGCDAERVLAASGASSPTIVVPDDVLFTMMPAASKFSQQTNTQLMCFTS